MRYTHKYMCTLNTYEYTLSLHVCHSSHVHLVSTQTVLTFPVDVDVEKLIDMQFFHNDSDDSDLANSSLRRKLFGKPNQKNCTVDTETHTEVCLFGWLAGWLAGWFYVCTCFCYCGLCTSVAYILTHIHVYVIPWYGLSIFVWVRSSVQSSVTLWHVQILCMYVYTYVHVHEYIRTYVCNHTGPSLSFANLLIQCNNRSSTSINFDSERGNGMWVLRLSHAQRSTLTSVSILGNTRNSWEVKILQCLLRDSSITFQQVRSIELQPPFNHLSTWKNRSRSSWVPSTPHPRHCTENWIPKGWPSQYSLRQSLPTSSRGPLSRSYKASHP